MRKNILIGVGIVGLLLLLNFRSMFCNAASEHDLNDSIKYHTITNPNEVLEIPCGLYATYKGKRYEIIKCPDEGDDYEKICIMLDTVLDFDGDGLNDALIEDLNGGCGSSYIPTSLFIVTPDKNLNFRVTENFGDSGYGGPTIEEWKGKLSIIKESWSGGVDGVEMFETTERFILKNGKVLRVENIDKKPIPASQELTSKKISRSKNEQGILLTDLDNDKLSDTIFGEYWSRWGTMNWNIRFGDGKNFEGSSTKRVGVLRSKTNGVNDIVLDFDEIMIWDGKKYIYKDTK